MALSAKDLSVLAYANGFTLWHYTTPDAGAQVTAAGYFNGAADMLRAGDLVLANLDTDGTPGAAIYRIASNTGSAVGVAALV